MFKELTEELLELTAETKGLRAARLGLIINIDCCSCSCCGCVAWCP